MPRESRCDVGNASKAYSGYMCTYVLQYEGVVGQTLQASSGTYGLTVLPQSVVNIHVWSLFLLLVHGMRVTVKE